MKSMGLQDLFPISSLCLLANSDRLSYKPSLAKPLPKLLLKRQKQTSLLLIVAMIMNLKVTFFFKTILKYQGGHIKEALNILCPVVLEKIFFVNKHLLYNPQYIEDLKKDLEGTLAKEKEHYENSPAENLKKKLPMIIFHCEFSQKRGPRAHRLLRNKDREVNFKNFPHMDYPEVFLLDGGYCNFYPQFPVRIFY